MKLSLLSNEHQTKGQRIALPFRSTRRKACFLIPFYVKMRQTHLDEKEGYGERSPLAPLPNLPNLQK